MTDPLSRLHDSVTQAHAWIDLLRRQIKQVVVGQNHMIDRLLVGLLSNGHVLLEGVPGLAKTLTIKTLAKIIDADFQRIQFTPDLLPADILGTLIYHPQDGQFHTKKGPIFAHLILADEINRAPAKVQSALLEAMQEQQVTIGDQSYPLPHPFLVLATQNPIDQEGTYPLPEAQIDRFMLKIQMGYPSAEEELTILDTMACTSPKQKVEAVVKPKHILEARSLVDQIYIDPAIKKYIVDLVLATRQPRFKDLDLTSFIQYGASPRATIALALASKAWAFLQGRAFVIPQDIKTIGMDVLRHRLILSFEAQAEDLTQSHLLEQIFSHVPVP